MPDKSFDDFMQQRRRVAAAFVNGDPGPLREISAAADPATFFGPSGGAEQGAAHVLEVNEAGSHRFHGGVNELEILHCGSSGELAYWTGAARPAGTGIPDAAIPNRATQTTVPSRDFGHHGDLPVSAGHDKAAVFVMLYGNTDEPLAWLRAGEALSAGWLTATEHGVSVVPHSAPIEVIATRQAMRAMIASVGYPCLVLRLGTIDPADTGTPQTSRLPAEQIIDRA